MGFGDDSKVKWVWILFHPYLIPSGLFLILFFHSVPLFSAEVLALPKKNGDALLWFIFSPLNDFLKYLSHSLLSLCLREKASSFFIIPRLFIISWPLNCAVACSASSSDSSWLPTSFILLYAEEAITCFLACSFFITHTVFLLPYCTSRKFLLFTHVYMFALLR